MPNEILSKIRDSALRLAGMKSTSTEVIALGNEAIDDTYKKLWKKYNWKEAGLANVEVDVAVNQRLVVFPKIIDKIWVFSEFSNVDILDEQDVMIFNQHHLYKMQSASIPTKYHNAASWVA